MAIFLPSLYNTSKYEDIEIETLIDIIKTGKYSDKFKRYYDIKDIIDRLRKEKDSELRTNIKKSLPCFNLADFGGEKKINMNFVESDYMIFDIDHFSSPEKADKVKDKLVDYALFFFTSPSGDGLKFAIQLKETIHSEQQFKQTYRNHFDFFINELELVSSEELRAKKDILDCKTCAPANAPFVSYDKDVYFNKDERRLYKFMVFKEYQYTKANVVSILSPNLCDEAYEICRFIASHPDPLHYDDWIKIGMSLYNVPNGLECWSIIPPSENYKNISPQDLERKFNTFKGTQISASTLYYYAIQKGYDAKKVDGESRFRTKFKFKDLIIMDKEGWFSPFKTKAPLKVFDFDSFIPEGTIYNDRNEQAQLFYINGELTPIGQVDIVSISAFKLALASKRKTSMIYMYTSHETAYNRLFEYIANCKSHRKYVQLSGVGHIEDKVWNLGNILYLNGKIVPVDNVVTTNRKTYLIDITEDLEFNLDREKMLETLSNMPKYYGKDLPTIMGWITAHVFFRYMIDRQIKFPMLFLHGGTGSGKSTLANMILHVFGVSPKALTRIHFSLAGKSTTNAVNNIRDTLNSIPIVLDEYKDMYAGELKVYYDRGSAVKARKTQDNQVYEKEVKSGTVVASVGISKNPETINRCAYVRLDTLSHNPDFTKDIERNLKYMGTYLVEVLDKFDPDLFFERAEEIENMIIDTFTVKETRLAKNYSLIMAGWEFAKDYFKGYKVIDNYWESKLEFIHHTVSSESYTDRFKRLLIRVLKDKNHKGLVTWVYKRGGAAKRQDNINGKPYYWIKFNFNANLWQSVIELDRRISNCIDIPMEEMKELFGANNYPVELKERANRTFRTDDRKVSSEYVWKLAIPTEECVDIDEDNNEEIELEEE